jgi:endogenous inhibitor of DNA gyrase (YacG/DUF329 family)
MAATKCPECERPIRFHTANLKGEEKFKIPIECPRCGTHFTAYLKGDHWPIKRKRIMK